MEFATAYLFFPLIAIVLTFGVGLLVKWITRTKITPSLLPAIGVAASIALVSPLYALGLGAQTAFIFLAFVAIAGFITGRSQLSQLRFSTATLVALATYLIYISPVLFTGKATFAGYNLLNDTSIHFILVDYLSDHGSRIVALEPSSFSSAVAGYVGTSYPLGSHVLLATLRFPLQTDVAWIYQSFLAFLMSLAALALFSLARSAGMSKLIAASAAIIASIAYLSFSFAMQGSIKEITLIAAAAVVARYIVTANRPLGYVAVLSFLCAAAFQVHSVGAVIWIASLVLLIAAYSWRRIRWLRTPSSRQWSLGDITKGLALFTLVFSLAAIPELINLPSFFKSAQTTLTAVVEKGNLPGSIDPFEMFGIWFNGDYRFTTAIKPLAYILVTIVFFLAMYGASRALTEREPGVLFLSVPPVVSLATLFLRASPWAEAKLLALASTGLIFLSIYGIVQLWKHYRPIFAVVPAVILILGVTISDYLVYKGAYLAPSARLKELKHIDREFSNNDVLLINEFEEYAKHFIRGSRVIHPYENWNPTHVGLLIEQGTLGRNFDLDDYHLSYLSNHPLILQRKSPIESRPPSNYEAVYKGRYYVLWRKTSGQVPLSRIKLGEAESPTSTVSCKEFKTLVKSVDSNVDEVVVAIRPSNYIVAFDKSLLPHAWKEEALFDQFLFDTPGPGKIKGFVTTEPGEYRIWLRGSFGREIDVSIDGKKLKPAQLLQGPRQSAFLGSLRLSSGRHSYVIEKKRASLYKPGDSYPGAIGSLILEPVGKTRIAHVPISKAERFCNRSLDWIELHTTSD